MTISFSKPENRMEPKKICIIHLNQIGDLIFSLPFLKSIRDRFPGASIHSVVRPYLEGLLRDSPLVDRIILRHETIRSKFALIKELRHEQYDLFISLTRSQEGLVLACLSGAHVRAGFAHFPWDLCLDVKEIIQGHNSWFNNANLLNRLGISVSRNSYVGLLSVNDPKPVPGLPERYAVVSPGASRRRLIKAWNEEKFALLVRRLYGEFNLPSVLVGGQDTRECTAAIADSAGDARIFDLAGKIGLRELYGVLARADLFVGIDSGVMHMASALDIPVIALFGPTDEAYVGPQNGKSTVVRKRMSCAPCYLREPCDHRKCMAEITVDMVIEACGKVLGV
jgi:ADP-heptose:LPS heptosyltransferase